ncbi:hypothetical protein CDAR_491851 [Caerostris darwini]|uniref:Uncharacterized protein n=1 Tax=Caerostris darwini TaxID=1538125 RepID=A0AAV4N0W0_9ARAC|nr:hypothetical protein CDAR_491851 [Caerostris darwini]
MVSLLGITTPPHHTKKEPQNPKLNFTTAPFLVCELRNYNKINRMNKKKKERREGKAKSFLCPQPFRWMTSGSYCNCNCNLVSLMSGRSPFIAGDGPCIVAGW